MFGASADNGDVMVWPDMRDGVMLFFGLSTQWRWISGMAGALRTGIDYAAVPAVASSLGITMQPSTFADVRTMESEAMTTWERKR